MTGALAIRRAGPGDAAALADLGARTFTLTFGHMYPPEDLAAYLAESHSEACYAQLLGDDRCALWLLEEAGGAVGFAFAGPCGLPHPEVTAADGELRRLYLLPEVQNAGWGGRLFAEAMAWLERDGPRTIWISVWSENFGAQRFYARHGFAKVAEYGYPVGRVRDREFMYRRKPEA